MWDIFKTVLSMRSALIVILTPILALPLPLCVPGQESSCAYVILIMAVFWMTEALPINVTALLPVFLFPVVGVISADVVAKSFFTSTTLMFIGGMGVAVAIEEWNIHKRIALKILLVLGSKPVWLMLGLMLTSWFLSMWISNTATTAMMLPIATAILNQLKESKNSSGDDVDGTVRVELISIEQNSDTNRPLHENPETRDSDGNTKEIAINRQTPTPTSVNDDDDDASMEWRQLGKALSLCIAYAANIGGTASMTGSTPNLVLKDQVDMVYGKLERESPLTFGTWLGFGVPTSLIIVLLSWVWLQAYLLRCRGWSSCYRSGSHLNEKKIKNVLRDQYRKLGGFSFGQGAVLCHLVAIAFLWITRDMGGAYGWAGLFKDKFIKDSVPAIFIGCLLFIFPSKLPWKHVSDTGDASRVPPLLSWRAFNEKMPWGVVFLLGGGFAMAKAAQESGLSAVIGEQLGSLGSLSPWLLNLVLCFIVAGVTEVSSNTATTVLILPILAQLATNVGIEPLYLMLPAAIAASFAFMLPVATPPNAVVFSYGYVSVADMVKAGFALNIIAVVVLVCSNETLGRAIFNIV